jgi:dihydroneopterin aldolase/2-amino-4-hydroxy-6-hydroxymethyldihydropteridine diphosphokinase/dihydropteroate synthase
MSHLIHLSLGSNLGHRQDYIQKALKDLEEKICIKKVSFLYETDPVGVLDQPTFLNAACSGVTDLDPYQLLEFLENIMVRMGRVREIKWGPRIIDIDIIFYDQLIIHNQDLIIPHPRLQDRSFVLEPLCDINPDFIHPLIHKKISILLDDIGGRSLIKVTPVGESVFRWKEKTFVMGIVNITNDSFSGDGLVGKKDDEIISHIQTLVDGGADCLDIGAMSTRPGHELISPEDEIIRLAHSIKLIRKHFSIPLSVDTFRMLPARIALEAGANIVNSIWGAEYDPDLLILAKEKRVPIVLTQNRAKTEYFQTDISLELMIKNALNAGIYPWHIIIDPGIGFVIQGEDNLKIIKSIPDYSKWGFPVLVGASRKKFLKNLVHKNSNPDLVCGNVIVHVLLSKMGADIVRVHDVEEVVDGLLISDTLTT